MKKLIFIISISIFILIISFSYYIFRFLLFSNNKNLLNLIWLLSVILIHIILLKFIFKIPVFILYKIELNVLSITTFILFILCSITVVFLQYKNYTFNKLLFILFIGVCGEEIILRGIIWDTLNKYLNFEKTKKLIVILFITSILFSIQHFQYKNFNFDIELLYQLIYTFLAGIILGIFRYQTNNLIIPIFIHSIGNSLIKIIIYYIKLDLF